MKYDWNSDSTVATLRQMQAWIRSFRIDGPGVVMRKTSDSCTISTSWPHRDFQAPPAGEIRTLKIFGAGSLGAPYGAGTYQAHVVIRKPRSPDSTGDLDLPDPGEAVGDEEVVFENEAESGSGNGTAAGHLLPIDGTCFVSARWTGGRSNDSPPQRVFRGYAVKGPVVAKVLDVYGSGSGGGGGAGRYKLAIGLGSVVALDPTSNFRPPDDHYTFPATFNAIGVNLFENGSAAAGTNVVAIGQIVIGHYVGFDNSGPPGLPVFYFGSAPTGTIFAVTLSEDGGTTNGSKTAAADLTYTATSLGGTQLGTGLSPWRTRGVGKITAATRGTGYIAVDGTFVLLEAFELPTIGGCT